MIILDADGNDSAAFFHPASTAPGVGVGPEPVSTALAVAVGPKLMFRLPDIYTGHPPQTKEEFV